MSKVKVAKLHTQFHKRAYFCERTGVFRVTYRYKVLESKDSAELYRMFFEEAFKTVKSRSS